jgi:predicted DsbA family dithiol-disulfide isomerase
MEIDVWADVLCPWCYLGEQRLSEAIEQSPHAGDITLKIHTFQLDPGASDEVTPLLDYLGKKYRLPPAQAREMEEGMARMAAADGLPYAVDRPASSTFDMLRVVQLGTEHGVGWDYLRALQAEVFGGDFEAFGHETLVRVGEKLGLDGDEIRDVLATDRYADAVREDHNAAISLGAQGVPFTVLGMRLGVPGAVSTEQYAAAIEQAWEVVHAG